MRKFRTSLFFITILLLVPAHVRSADQFEIFDDRAYNGKYYPLVDIIQNEVPSQMFFNIHTVTNPNKIKPGPQLPAPKVEISLMLEKEGKKRVMLVNYYIPERKEHLCRRVLAPNDFEDGFIVYRDTSDGELDTYIVSMTPVVQKAGIKKVDFTKYASCENAPAERLPAAATLPAPAVVENTKVQSGIVTPAVTNDAAIKGKAGSLSDFSKW